MGRHRKSRGNFTQNHGKAGVVYALGNKTLPNYLKIGQTRHLDRRLASLNAGCNTSNPIRGFFVAYSQETDDCGRAELHAHQALAHCRVDAYREFFECSVETAKRVIDDACMRFRASPLEPKPPVIETPRQPSAWEREAEAARLRHQAQIQRAKEAERAAEEVKRRKREEDLRTAELIRKVNREAQEKKAAHLPAASDPAPVLNSGAFRIVAPAQLESPGESASGLKILLSVFGALIGISIISSFTTPAPSTPVPEQAASDILAADLAAYAARYVYPRSTAADETTLAQVRTEGRNLVFEYKSTDRGEHVMAKQFDPDHIRRAMTNIACSKDDVRAFLARGVTIFYVLERSNGSRLVQHIACARPGQ